jgi:hypothetical protein
MADVSIYVAVISAAAGIVGATVPQASTAIREARRAERDRQDRLSEERRQAYVQLLRTVLDLRVLVANSHEHHGGEMAARLAEMRQFAADARVTAAGIELMVQAPPALGDTAERLAQAADRLAEAVAENASLPPDFRELDECIRAFKDQCLQGAGGDRR